MKRFLVFAVLLLLPFVAQAQRSRLAQNGVATQLTFDNEPFIILGGELGNSTASSSEYMDSTSAWERLAQTGLNTVLAPVSWELIEEVEGRFDFESVDYLLRSARANNQHLVLLWFGSWKNSMSCYAPQWVKHSFGRRFALAQNADGQTQEIMSAFSEAGVQADARAFAALMRHLREVDKEQGTVLMVQVENEIGMIGDARDHSDLADKAYRRSVPSEIIAALTEGRANDFLTAKWRSNGSRTRGSWGEVFGEGIEGDEIFMAYHFARYTERVAAAGRAEYPLPMFVNAALNSRGRRAGEYPAAGPLAHLSTLWQVAAPSLDLLAPDVYDAGYARWVAQYATADNPLFVPESHLVNDSAARAFYTLGRHAAIGFCPFAIENIPSVKHPLSRAYHLLTDILPLVAQKQAEGKAYAALCDTTAVESTITVGDVTFVCRHDLTLGWNAEAADRSKWGETAVMILDMGDDQYLFIGTGVVTVARQTDGQGKIGIDRIDEVCFGTDGSMHRLRRLNGDENHQGRHIRIPFGSYEAQLLKVYRYR